MGAYGLFLKGIQIKFLLASMKSLIIVKLFLVALFRELVPAF